MMKIKINNKGDNRTFVQSLVLILTNMNIPGFINGTIFKGKSKYICVPGLNCYSCPGAIASCPIGSLQAILGSAEYKFSFYILGLLAFFGVMLGRFVCGWLCPFGFLQDIIYKIKVKKLKMNKKIDEPLRWFKYFILATFVILMPIFLRSNFNLGDPYFCKYICPSGTFMAGIPMLILNAPLRNSIGFLFGWKMIVLISVVVSSVFIYRTFCKYLCPLGAFYALFNKISFYQMQIDEHKCTKCKACERHCNMNVAVTLKPNHSECIRCGDCIKACPHGAIKSGFLVKDDADKNQIKRLLKK